MSPFPVTSSILSATHLATFLQDRYAFSGNTTCRLIRSGINDTYLVQGNGDLFVFRVYSLDWRTPAAIGEEVALLDRLNRKEVPVSYAVADREGWYLQTLPAPEGKRFAVLFTHAPGEKLHNYEEAIHETIGSLMARFHQAAADAVLPARTYYNADTLLVASLEALAPFLPADTEEMGLMRTMQQHLLVAYAGADEKKIRKGIVHLDIWFDNLNITQKGAVTIFDFDFCGNGWQCLDIAYYVMQLFVVEPEESRYKSKMDAFLKGYEAAVPISNEEKRLLPALGVCLYFFYLGVQCRRFDNFSNVFISETYLKRYITQRVKKYFDYHRLGDDGSR